MSEVPVFKFALCEEVKNDKRFLPTRAHPGDTGWDVRATKSLSLRAGQYAKIPLGFRVFAPSNFWLELRPRSSSFAKKQLHCLYGVIDFSFEGQMVWAIQYLPDISSMGQDLEIKFGDAIAQLIPVRRQEMLIEDISNEEYDRLCQERKGARGTGGFGSSDVKERK